MDEQPIIEGKEEILHPAFAQCLPVFLVPFILFLFLFYGVKLYYVLVFFWILETSFLCMVWIHLATTYYVVFPDRIEIRSGVWVKRSKSIPLNRITEISYKQTLFQRMFRIGDLFIDTAGDKSLEAVMAGVEYPEQITECLFGMVKGARL